MAAAAGLPLVGDDRRVEATTTYGVGELLIGRAELDHEVEDLVHDFFGARAGTVDLVHDEENAQPYASDALRARACS